MMYDSWEKNLLHKNIQGVDIIVGVLFKYQVSCKTPYNLNLDI